MEAKQVKFRALSDTIESTKDSIGGIGIYNGWGQLQYVICGCCGGIFEPKEVEIVRGLEWVPLSAEIIGE